MQSSYAEIEGAWSPEAKALTDSSVEVSGRPEKEQVETALVRRRERAVVVMIQRPLALGYVHLY